MTGTDFLSRDVSSSCFRNSSENIVLVILTPFSLSLAFQNGINGFWRVGNMFP